MSVKAPIEVIPETFSYVFSPYREPIARVAQGQRVIIHCEDAFESRILSTRDLPSHSLANAKCLNPQTGPIYIEGAEPGDVIAVTIEDIEPARVIRTLGRDRRSYAAWHSKSPPKLPSLSPS